MTDNIDEVPEMTLVHGSYKEHYDTAMRAKRNGVTRVWSGDLRNPYLAENVMFIEHEKIAEVSIDDDESAYINQASYVKIDWI